MKTAILAFMASAVGAMAGFVTLDVSSLGQVCTDATGISGDKIVGSYTDGSGTHYGLYSISQDQWIALDIPGLPMGIDGDKIVGSYTDGSGTHGFLYDGFSWVAIDGPPGVTNTVASGISGDNVVGWYIAGSTYNGFYYWGDNPPPTLDLTEAGDEQVYAIDENDHLVGSYTDGSGTHGFFYDWVDLTTLNAPNATSTIVYDIDGDYLVGSYTDGSGTHGFLTLNKGTTYTALNVPGATSTVVYGIDGDKIVGSYTDGSGTHGFICTVALTLSNVGVKQPENLFGFTINGPNSSAVVVEVSTNLGSWSVIDNPTLNSAGTFDFIDSGWTSFAQRFYRVRWP